MANPPESHYPTAGETGFTSQTSVPSVVHLPTLRQAGASAATMFKPLGALACLLFATTLASCSAPADDLPHSYAMVLFPGFAPLDVFGPLGPLQMAAFHHAATLHLVAETLDPVSSQLASNSTFSQSVVPTSTFEEFLAAGTEVDVLVVPGGPGVRVSDEKLAPVVDFVRELYPNVEYLLAVCTGSGIAARAGILDGRRATTNKAAWDEITAMGPDVEWVSPARWVVDGNIWSSSGVSLPSHSPRKDRC